MEPLSPYIHVKYVSGGGGARGCRPASRMAHMVMYKLRMVLLASYQNREIFFFMNYRIVQSNEYCHYL